MRAAAFLVLAFGFSSVNSEEGLGKKVFTQIAQPPCALCHTLEAAGASGTIGPSLDELKPDKARVLDTVRAGIGPMPPYEGKLTPEQIQAVADFVANAVK